MATYYSVGTRNIGTAKILTVPMTGAIGTLTSVTVTCYLTTTSAANSYAGIVGPDGQTYILWNLFELPSSNADRTVTKVISYPGPLNGNWVATITDYAGESTFFRNRESNVTIVTTDTGPDSVRQIADGQTNSEESTNWFTGPRQLLSGLAYAGDYVTALRFPVPDFTGKSITYASLTLYDAAVSQEYPGDDSGANVVIKTRSGTTQTLPGTVSAMETDAAGSSSIRIGEAPRTPTVTVTSTVGTAVGSVTALLNEFVDNTWFTSNFVCFLLRPGATEDGALVFSNGFTDYGNGSPVLYVEFADAVSGVSIVGDTGVFVITGIDADVPSPGNGRFVIIGNDASIVRSPRIIDCESGAFAITGIPSSESFARAFDAQSGSFIISGKDGPIVVPSLSLSADPGTFTITGGAGDVTPGNKIICDTGTLTISSPDSPFDFGIPSDSGSFAISGADASFLILPLFINDTGGFSINGQSANFTTTSLGAAKHLYHHYLARR